MVISVPNNNGSIKQALDLTNDDVSQLSLTQALQVSKDDDVSDRISAALL